jgi:hypothetical protein
MDVTRNARLFKAALVALAAGASVAAGVASAASLTVPVSQSIPVALTQTLTSQSSHVGDPFTFVTTKAVTLGTITLPKGTPGHGRLAVVQPADGKNPGQLGLQADSLDLPDGDTVWVNIDASKPPKGHLANKHTKPIFLPLPVGFGGGYRTTSSGNMILDSGTTFSVVTIAPRAAPAALMTATPTPLPTPTPTPAPTRPPKHRRAMATPLPTTTPALLLMTAPPTAPPMAPSTPGSMTPPAPPSPGPSSR